MSTNGGMVGQSGCGCTVYGVSQVDISGDSHTVSIVGLQTIFRQRHNAGRMSDDRSM